MKQIVERLTQKNRTIATMESCTGGGIVNAITNVEGASSVLKFSAVTYANEFKIKMGVSRDIIDEYSVYSMETADAMSYNISKFAASDYGIGVTGKLNRIDKRNLFGEDDVVFISIYDSISDKYYHAKVEAIKKTRQENKDLIIDKIEAMLLEII